VDVDDVIVGVTQADLAFKLRYSEAKKNTVSKLNDKQLIKSHTSDPISVLCISFIALVMLSNSVSVY